MHRLPILVAMAADRPATQGGGLLLGVLIIVASVAWGIVLMVRPDFCIGLMDRMGVGGDAPRWFTRVNGLLLVVASTVADPHIRRVSTAEVRVRCVRGLFS